jgi:hypothetical protein
MTLEALIDQWRLHPSPEVGSCANQLAGWLRTQPAPAPQLDADTEHDLRIYLWLSHGHKFQYGDDGEMQCAECRSMQDYKRAPLADVVWQARVSRQAVNQKILTLASRGGGDTRPLPTDQEEKADGIR